MYLLQPTNKFLRKAKKLTQKNPNLKEKIKTVLLQLENNPFSKSLNTHKVKDINGKNAYSSRISGDIRIIWDFSGTRAEILDILDIGGHSGKNKIYQ